MRNSSRQYRELRDSSDELGLFVGQDDYNGGGEEFEMRSMHVGDFDDYDDNNFLSDEDFENVTLRRRNSKISKRRKRKRGIWYKVATWWESVVEVFDGLILKLPCQPAPPDSRTFTIDGTKRLKGFPDNVINNQKYNLITFLPVVLYHQFKFFFNFYFLIVALSQFIAPLKIGYLYTYWGPLLFVIFVTVAKEGWDDLLRYRRDREVNGAQYERLHSGGTETVTSAQIKVGDVLLIHCNQRVPADCILLRTTEKAGANFIRTDQLDGETDWKLRIAVSTTQTLENETDLFNLNCTIFADRPIKDIHTFVGNFESEDGDVEPLSVDNTLWANTVVASGTATAVVIYTGKESRSVMNTSMPENKVGLLDKEINVLAKMLFILTMILSFLLVALKGFDGAWYIYLFRFVLLFSYIIPISLRVNLDMGKTVYAYFIENDPNIPDTIVRTSTIPEELGRIQYLLSDKTGTLTQNEMVFKRLHMGTVSFGSDTFCDIEDAITSTLRISSPNPRVRAENEDSLLADNSSFGTNQRIRNVVFAIAVCHNVTPVYEGDEIVDYQAASPDEVALVKWTASVGLQLVHRDLHNITLSATNIKIPAMEYAILNVFPFTSETKRMGIIVREKLTNKIIFFMKGADTMMAKIVMFSDWLDEECGNMSREGLRCLVVARKVLSETEYNTFNKKYLEAKASVANRNENVQAAIETLEYELELLGVTGVEDKLQEDIKPTLELLRNAGVRIWMLTGDKMETATCIAISSRLVSRTQSIYQFAKVNNQDEAYHELSNFQMKVDCVLVIDGHALKICMSYLEDDFIEIAALAPAVVCCRCSPTQKADIVRLIKNYTGVQTCGIGDGGNDVSMIQAADVGIGIVGKEGKQASLAADVSITQFKHLAPLLLWHGRNSYKRSSHIAQFIIHRGLIISVIQAVFSSVFYFSAIALYQGLLMVGYATVYTMFPVFSLVLDEDVGESLVMMYPELYKDLVKGRSLTLKTFFAWVLVSVYQGAAIMIGALLLFDSGDFVHIVSISFTALILTELLMVALTINKFHWLMIASLLLSLTFYILSIIFLTEYFDIRFVATGTFVWKVTVITLVSCFPLFFLKQLSHHWDPPSYSKLT